LIPAGQIFVIGDSHIGLSDGNEAPILSWLDRLSALRPRALYLNGDLFHYLIAHPKFYTQSVANVFTRFRALRDGGMPIHYVEGNRDFFLRGSFAEESVTDVSLEYAVQAGDRKYLIVHGDMINDRDIPYRFWRWASKSAISRFGLRFIPKKTARNFVDRVEGRLSNSNFKHKANLPIARMEAYGRQRGVEGFTDVIFGHFHEKLVLQGPPQVMVLPPWYETGEAMAIDPVSGSFQFVEI
jgi:UDP-2,3-diacylglucosamine hydrolase